MATRDHDLRLPNDDLAFLPQFHLHGDKTASLPFEARPATWFRGLAIGVPAILLWGALLSGVFTWAAPGPLGTLITAGFALILGASTGVAGAAIIGKHDTPERPLKFVLGRVLADAGGTRPEAPTTTTSTTQGLFPPVTRGPALSTDDLWRSCDRRNCEAPPPRVPEAP